ncbi:MAG: DUF4347 domain-containing protein, partial [Mariprofundaceae bacterium]|nr:DUF4347 domain-containing protein [Mariprofundaceae bacterium]
MAFKFGPFGSKKHSEDDDEMIRPDPSHDEPGFHDVRKRTRIESMLALEPRILLDAALADTAAKVADAVAAHGVVEHVSGKPQSDVGEAMAAMAPMLKGDQIRREVVFVDAAAENIEALLGKATPQRQVVVLDAGSDGVQQMTEALQHMGKVDAVHIFSHGEGGRIQLGKGELSLANIQQYREQLKGLAAHMTNAADILVYGCNVAEGARGADFVRMLAELTQADVAASTDLTGASDAGGDWDLEKIVGDIETDVALSVHGRDQFRDTLAFPATNTAFGSSANFSADGNIIPIDNTGGVLISAAGNMSYEAWIRPTAQTSLGTIIGSEGIGNPATPGALALNTDGKVWFYTQKKGTPNVFSNLVSTGTVDTTGNVWTHVAATRDAAGNTKIYINGSLNKSGTVTAGTDFTPLYIGSRTSLSAKTFKGDINQVAIWQGAAVKSSFNTTTPLVCNEADLVGYWKFDT